MRRFFCVTVCLLFLMGCGGGGGGGGTGSGDPAPSSATLYLSTAGTLPEGQLISGVTVTVNLPAGVTMQSVTPSGQVAGGTVVIDPANTDSGKVTFSAYGSSAFGKGQFATIACSVAAGNTPSATDFSIAPGATATSNVTFDSIPTLSVTFAADIH